MASSPLSKPSKFTVYQNPAVSSALTTCSLEPSKFAFALIFSISSVSALFLLSFLGRENGIVDALRFGYLPQPAAYLLAKALQAVVSFIFLGTVIAFFNAVSLNRTGKEVRSPSKGTQDQQKLSNRQLELIGLKPKANQCLSDSSRKPPKSKHSVLADALIPLHQPITSSVYNSRAGLDSSMFGSGNKMNSFNTTPSKSQGSPYLMSSNSSPSFQISPGQDMVSTPWSNKRGSSRKEITTEDQLERFLAEIDEKITESAGKMTTPPPTISTFGMVSPNALGSSANTSGTTRSTPLRPVRMSPGSQKFTTPPKKGEGDPPSPMSMEEAIECYERLGIYPQIEQWRDSLRQWLSLILLKPLLNRIETSHIQVMQATAKLGITVKVSQVGGDLSSNGTPTSASPIDRNMEWQPAYTLDEDGILQQLRANLVQAIDASIPKLAVANPQQQNPMIPVMQECLDTITEHQRLQALMKGEWVKGLLPHGSIPADYTVQRIRELAEGTCIKNYEYLGTGETHEKKKNKWSLDLPTDSHLLMYLFCAFLEHPKWMLHLDPTAHSGTQSSKNPLFLGVLPPKDRFPEKYVAIISGIPSTLHPGACILAVGRQSLPMFVLYWDKKLQLCLQGRTALWDSLLLLCHRIKVSYGGVVRGMHLGSSALNLLPVLDSEAED